jgi:hypothetical protein
MDLAELSAAGSRICTEVPSSGRGVRADELVALADEPLHHRHAQARVFALRLGREERLEDIGVISPSRDRAQMPVAHRG